MFWLSAMPTPDLQCRQRLLTLMLDDEIAAPSWPLVSSQAAIDKVIQLVLYWLPVGEKLHTVTGARRITRAAPISSARSGVAVDDRTRGECRTREIGASFKIF
jgi:hypothetical protein